MNIQLRATEFLRLGDISVSHGNEWGGGSSGMLRRVDWYDVSEVLAASVMALMMLAVPLNHRAVSTRPHVATYLSNLLP
jgi:hypothetical protein